MTCWSRCYAEVRYLRSGRSAKRVEEPRPQEKKGEHKRGGEHEDLLGGRIRDYSKGIDGDCARKKKHHTYAKTRMGWDVGIDREKKEGWEIVFVVVEDGKACDQPTAHIVAR